MVYCFGSPASSPNWLKLPLLTFHRQNCSKGNCLLLCLLLFDNSNGTCVLGKLRVVSSNIKGSTSHWILSTTLNIIKVKSYFYPLSANIRGAHIQSTNTKVKIKRFFCLRSEGRGETIPLLPTRPPRSDIVPVSVRNTLLFLNDGERP